MLIIPITGKISKKNIPLVTIGIILLNSLIFFVFQTDDDERFAEAMDYYFESGLAGIEARHYLKYSDRPETQEALSKQKIQKIFFEMSRDDVFQMRLENHEIIQPGHEDFERWYELRTKFEKLESKVTYVKYGFTPAYKKPTTYLTSMFLHGGFMHLLGNMVFLWLVGCVLEGWCGRSFFLALYLITGILADVVFGVVYPSSTVPCVGASGAISGLMGAYAIPFGRRKIRVFYSLGFYFNYAKMPAIILLPIWIGKELYMILFGGVSQVAYAAHLGGLLSGAVIAFLNLKVFGWTNEEAVREDPKERIPSLLDQAYACLEKLDMQGARVPLEKVLEIEPDHPKALSDLFNIDKLEPESGKFTQTASRLLVRQIRKNDREELLKTYKEIYQANKNPNLNPDLLLRVSTVFMAPATIAESERLIALTLKKAPTNSNLPTSILHLGKKYLEMGKREEGITCLKVLISKFGDTNEAQIAQGLLHR